MPTKKTKTTPRKKRVVRKTKKSKDYIAMNKAMAQLHKKTVKALQDIDQKFDIKAIREEQGGIAEGKGYYFLLSESDTYGNDDERNTFTWGQSHFNFPSTAVAGTLDGAARSSIEQDLLNLFATSLGSQFSKQYGEDFAEALSKEFYKFLQKVT